MASDIKSRSTTGNFSYVIQYNVLTPSASNDAFQLEHALTFVSRMDEGPMQKTVQNKIVEICTSLFWCRKMM